MTINTNLIYLFYLFFLKTLISQNSPESPNFIFILADDQGWNGTSNKMMDSQDYSKRDYY